MNNSRYIILLFLPLLFGACTHKDAESGFLRLRFVPTYDGKVLPMYETVNNPDGFPMKIKRLSFFAQVLDGAATLKDQNNVLALIDLTDLTDKTKAEQGVVRDFALRPGEYPVLNLGIGVPASLNAKQPQDFPSSNPLSEESQYWQSWKSYIFTKTEGALDTLKNGIFGLQFSYHTGIDEMYRTVALTKNFKIVDGQTTELTIEIDVREILNGKGGSIDPRKNQNAHSLNNKALAVIISNNYKTALKVK